MKARRGTLKNEALPPMIPIIPLSLITSTPIQEVYKTLSKDILKELIKHMRELKVKMNELKKI